MSVRGFALSTLSVGGFQFTDSPGTLNSNSAVIESILCTQAQPGQLTTRTNATVGIVTMNSANHGLVNTEFADLYFSGGQRRSVEITGVSGVNVNINAGFGANLPVVNTYLNVAPVSTLSVGITGANVLSIGFQVAPGSTSDGNFSLQTSVPAEALGANLVSGADYLWYSGNGVTNPVTGSTLTAISCSTNNVTSNQTIQGVIQYS